MAETEWKAIWQELESLKRENKYLRNLLDVTLDKVVEIERRINRVEEKVNPGLELYYREYKGIGYAGKYNFEQIDESARELIKNLFYEAAKKISSPSFETWFTGTITDARLTEDLLIIYANNDFGRDWLETKYSDLIHEIVAKFLQREVQIQFVKDR
ncbi:DnaA N-terminal domain-containing protein [Caldibacillus debilis]|uniref:ATPase involved in DNA replication initiation n=1 Tax=Caldibacillus debilis GB1 TaxID=1339248 RepID=A0A420VD83_9BACI|nr:DnaA N-terminal domain-containing protein [Caldibacillus debilis]RKO61496.1 ATPase involved in DNA replication initiation [Caldibacillus debilis GB1]